MMKSLTLKSRSISSELLPPCICVSEAHFESGSEFEIILSRVVVTYPLQTPRECPKKVDRLQTYSPRGIQDIARTEEVTNAAQCLLLYVQDLLHALVSLSQFCCSSAFSSFALTLSMSSSRVPTNSILYRWHTICTFPRLQNPSGQHTTSFFPAIP